jgi:hypothetical protein
MDSSKVIVKRTRRFGRGVFATAVIQKNEVIAAFDGPIYDAKFDGWTEDLLNHAMAGFCGNRTLDQPFLRSKLWYSISFHDRGHAPN